MNELDRYFELIAERPELFINNGNLSIIKDRQKIIAYMNTYNKKIGVIYESPFNTFVVDLVQDKNQDIFTYERLIKEDNSVIVIVKYENKYLLLKQYRHALRCEQYAFVRGFGEKGLSAEKNALKEVEEEIGGRVTSIKELSSIVLDSGLCGSEAKVFVVEISEYNIPIGYEGIKEYKLVTTEKLVEMIRNGFINDSPTLSAFCLERTSF